MAPETSPPDSNEVSYGVTNTIVAGYAYTGTDVQLSVVLVIVEEFSSTELATTRMRKAIGTITNGFVLYYDSVRASAAKAAGSRIYQAIALQPGGGVAPSQFASGADPLLESLIDSLVT